MSEFISPLALPVVAAVASGALAIAFFFAYTQGRGRGREGPRLRTIHRVPTSWPVIGDLVQVLKNYDRTYDWLTDNCLHFNGEPWRLCVVGQTDHIVFSTPDAFEDVLSKQFHNFPHGEGMNLRLRQLLGDSILTTDGDAWFHHRKTAAKFFTSKALRECMQTTMKKNVGQLQEALDASIAKRQPIDLTKLLFQFTLQTFTEAGLGVDLRWIGKEEASPFEEFLSVGSAAVMRRFMVPDVAWQLQRWLGVGLEGEFLTRTKSTRAWLNSLVQQSVDAAIKRQESKSNDHSVKNVVELFLESSASEEGLVDFLLDFVLAAQDTSALSMLWLFLMLSKHPEVEHRIRDEMQSMLPSMDVDQTTYLTTEHVQQLVYLEATIREVLRLYPVLPCTRREILSDTIVCGDIPLRKGDVALLSIYGMARNPNVWGPDAAQFNPSRWINTTTGQLEVYPAAKFAAFGAGPRACVGMKLAMMELRVTVANLLHRYRFSLAVPHTCRYAIELTLAVKEPVLMNVERIAEDKDTGA